MCAVHRAMAFILAMCLLLHPCLQRLIRVQLPASEPFYLTPATLRRNDTSARSINEWTGELVNASATLLKLLWNAHDRKFEAKKGRYESCRLTKSLMPHARSVACMFGNSVARIHVSM